MIVRTNERHSFILDDHQYLLILYHFLPQYKSVPRMNYRRQDDCKQHQGKNRGFELFHKAHKDPLDPAVSLDPEVGLVRNLCT